MAGVEAADVQGLAGELLVDEGLRLAVVAPARRLRGLERRLGIPRDAVRGPTMAPIAEAPTNGSTQSGEAQAGNDATREARSTRGSAPATPT